jgi:hypothetical protein
MRKRWVIPRLRHCLTRIVDPGDFVYIRTRTWLLFLYFHVHMPHLGILLECRVGLGRLG